MEQSVAARSPRSPSCCGVGTTLGVTKVALGRGDGLAKGLCRCCWIQWSVLQSIRPTPSSMGKPISPTCSQHGFIYLGFP